MDEAKKHAGPKGIGVANWSASPTAAKVAVKGGEIVKISISLDSGEYVREIDGAEADQFEDDFTLYLARKIYEHVERKYCTPDASSL